MGFEPALQRCLASKKPIALATDLAIRAPHGTMAYQDTDTDEMSVFIAHLHELPVTLSVRVNEYQGFLGCIGYRSFTKTIQWQK